MIYKTCDSKFSVVLNEDCLSKVLSFSIKALPMETGGILIGHYSTDLKSAIVTDVIGPPGDSIRLSSLFVRGIKGLQKVLNTYWRKKHYYLGEWHLHPFASALSSQDDDNQMIAFSKNNSMHCPEPVLIILGGNPRGEWSLKIFLYAKGIKQELIKLL